jgi:hypothetical protein
MSFMAHQQHLKAPGLQKFTQREPIDPGRFQGHRRDPARGQPVGQALSVNRVRAKAAHRLGLVTGGHRHIMRFSPHVEARRMPDDGGQLGWESGLGARLWLLAVSPGRLRQHKGHRQRQWGRERRR